MERGYITIGMKRRWENKEEEDDSDGYGVLDEAPRKWDQAERIRIDGIVAEHLTLFQVSELFLGRY